VKLVAVFALPAGIAETQPAERAAHAVLASTVVLTVTVVVVVDHVRDAVAVVIVVVRGQEPVTVYVGVEAVRFTVTIHVGIVSVFETISVHIRIRPIFYAVSVNVGSVLRVVGIATGCKFFKIAQPVVVTVDAQERGDFFIG
jgi:hypothetical protein